MKNYKTRFILVVSIFSILSCSKDFIELSSISEASSEDFYKTSSDFENAVTACYDALQSNDLYGQAFDRLIAIRADDAVDDNSSSSTRAADVDKFQESSTNRFVNNAWRGSYIGISRCNIVISRIDGASIDASLKNQLKAEAQFVRALIYFNAVRMWGEVPLITKEQTVLETNQQIQDKTLIRNSIADVYTSIIQDLTFAQQNLPLSNSIGKATSGAAKSLLGKVYLTQGNYSSAQAILSEVIGKYDLLTSFGAVFDVANKNNKEIIFAVAYNKNLANEGHSAWYNNGNFVLIPQTLLDSYDANDARLSLVETSENQDGFIMPGKFFDEQSQNQFGNDFPVLRYSDVLLMSAEALNEIGYVADGEAFDLLNKVRNRAGLSSYTSSDLVNRQEFRDAVLWERKLELALEYDRWFDLLRTGTAITEMAKVGLTITNDDLLFPIPQSEIEIINNPSGFPQNPSY
ncbi:RagB/SusD family nutrient uptake outer membrane protein [Gelidibacter salicanalis]|uniref:RagB/SusD family nutrient uptake outer membrane protein n=1 Tax=Gelidibacter salicanalis TaxID=291193 RepID=A0A934KMF5_9FLAO|nr:RagB/SusD family nutrient uptake outer membrane protein [Gelidibacter salicanalis]MBJ7881902.1 RagB/SusD family nutrient uptake outer membrane protein [Gelidibacter salicanalis]